MKDKLSRRGFLKLAGMACLGSVVVPPEGSMSHRSVANPAALGRANYMKVLSSYVLKS